MTKSRISSLILVVAPPGEAAKQQFLIRKTSWRQGGPFRGPAQLYDCPSASQCSPIVLRHSPAANDAVSLAHDASAASWALGECSFLIRSAYF